jgi:hypothetical protein
VITLTKIRKFAISSLFPSDSFDSSNSPAADYFPSVSLIFRI